MAESAAPQKRTWSTFPASQPPSLPASQPPSRPGGLTSPPAVGVLPASSLRLLSEHSAYDRERRGFFNSLLNPMLRHSLEYHAGSHLIIWVDPSKILYDLEDRHWIHQRYPVTGRPLEFLHRYKDSRISLLSTSLTALLRRLEPFVIPPRFYPKAVEVEETYRYLWVKDFLENRQSPRGSLWYNRLAETLHRTGAANHKDIIMRSEHDIDVFFQYLLALVESLESEGYRLDKSPDHGTACVGPNGVLHKSAAGRHRFCISRILGVKAIPVKITGVHREWFDSHVMGRRAFRLPALLGALKEVEREYS